MAEDQGEIAEMLGAAPSAVDEQVETGKPAETAPPSGDVDTPVDTGTQDQPEAQPSTATADAAEKRAAAGQQSDDPKTKPDPNGLSDTEREAINRLAGDKPADTPKPKEPAAPAPKPGATTDKAPPKPGTEKKTDAPVDLSEQELARLDEKTRKAFAGMRTESKAMKTQLAELRPLAEQGQYWGDLFAKHEAVNDLQAIGEDEHVGVVRIQAAINRAYRAHQEGKELAAFDLQILQAADKALSDSFAQIGIDRASTAPALPEPYAGYLTEEHKLLIQSGFSEASVRQLIAIEDAKKGEAGKPAKTAPTRTAAPPAPPTRAAAPPQRAPARGSEIPEDVRKHASLTRAMLSEAGVGNGEHEFHLSVNLLPIVLRDLIKPVMHLLPGSPTDALQVFNGASPKARHDLLTRAQKRFEDVQKRAAAPATQRPPSPAPNREQRPLTQRDTRGVGTRIRSTASTSDPAAEEKARVAFLAGEG